MASQSRPSGRSQVEPWAGIGGPQATPQLPRTLGRTALGGEGKSGGGETKTLIRTGQAEFLSPREQSLILSPNGVRTGRFVVEPHGVDLLIEVAPTFGDEGQSTGMASMRDVRERINLVESSALGIINLAGATWLDDRMFLVTSTDASMGLNSFGDEKTLAWIADARLTEDRGPSKATQVPVTSDTCSLHVPVGIDSLPLRRLDDRGNLEVLLVFKDFAYEPGRKYKWTWAWYNTQDGAVEDAAVDTDFPTSEWREVILDPLYGAIDAVLANNGTVFRRSPNGWLDLGEHQIAAREGMGTMDAAKHWLQQQYLVSTAADYTVYAVDSLGAFAKAPQNFPPAGDLLVEDIPSGSAMADWVLEQSKKRKTAALVQLQSGRPPRPLFVHPFADLTVKQVFLSSSGEPLSVVVDDLTSRAYALGAQAAGSDDASALKRMIMGGKSGDESSSKQGAAMASIFKALREKVPETVTVSGVSVSGKMLEPLSIEQHSKRWLAYFRHPVLVGRIALPCRIEGSEVVWIGAEAFRQTDEGQSLEALTLSPVVEPRRIPIGGGRDVPAYLILPSGAQPAGLVVRVPDGVGSRFKSGADGMDGWLVSRGYAVLKVNPRGSAGFGQAWAAAEATEDRMGFLDDIVAAVRWALDTRKVLGETVADKPAVAVMGSYFGGYAAVQAMLYHSDLFACGVAIAPTQALTPWPASYVPNAEARARIEEEGKNKVLAPGARAADLQNTPLLVIEYEKDSDQARDVFINRIAPLGCSAEEWPKKLHYVQYAGESHGGGAILGNLHDQYYRIDGFLYGQLSKLTGGDRQLSREARVDEAPFISAALLPSTMGKPSETVRDFEQMFEQLLETMDAAGFKDIANLTEPGAKYYSSGGFGGDKMGGEGKRGALPQPKHRVTVRPDGILEVTIVFPEEPEGLTVFLSEVALHIRAKRTAMTMMLPRKPIPGAAMWSFRLPDKIGYTIQIPADISIGAIENWQLFNMEGRYQTLMSYLLPKDFAKASQKPPDPGPADAASQDQVFEAEVVV